MKVSSKYSFLLTLFLIIYCFALLKMLVLEDHSVGCPNMINIFWLLRRGRFGKSAYMEKGLEIWECICTHQLACKYIRGEVYVCYVSIIMGPEPMVSVLGLSITKRPHFNFGCLDAWRKIK